MDKDRNVTHETKWERAKKIVESYGVKEDDDKRGFDNFRKQVFAKLIVNGKTIGKDMNTGKLYVK